MSGQRANVALFWIKFLHTAVFLGQSAAILYILYSGISAVGGPVLTVAVLAVLAEIIVFTANGMRCPLTKVARDLGDVSGNDFIADIFLPQRFARAIPFVCGGLAIVGLLLVGVRILFG